MLIRVERYAHGLMLGSLCWLLTSKAAAQGFSRALKPLDDAADFAAAFVAHRFWHAIFVGMLALGLVAYAWLKRSEALWGVLVTGIVYILYIARDDIFSGWQ